MLCLVLVTVVCVSVGQTLLGVEEGHEGTLLYEEGGKPGQLKGATFHIQDITLLKQTVLNQYHVEMCIINSNIELI